MSTALLIFWGLALLAPLLTRFVPRASGIVLAVVVMAVGVWFASCLPAIAGETDRIESWMWIGPLDLAMSFRLDGLGLTFALLICFIGGFVLLYSNSYLRDHPRLGTFLATLVAFMAAMLGLVLANNLLLVFVFWELTSITSFLLIGFDHTREQARRSALQALLVTALGGLVLLAGLILLGLAACTFEINAIDAQVVKDHALFVPAVVLILIGCFSKSAIFPFHFWLPNAMEAPSPVSALLHSSTMVKAGVYLVARLHPTFGGTLLWDDTLLVAGGITMLLGAFLATRQHALKRILAYSTVSSLGALMLLIGMGAAKAAAAYLLAHAMFKGCLFLVAGTITKQTGEKNPAKLHGLIRTMPLLGVTGILGALSMAGMFPLAGFVGKELILKAGLAHPDWAIPVVVFTLLAAVLTVMAAIVVAIRPFIGAAASHPQASGAIGWQQLTGPIVLAILGLIAGLMPSLFSKPLVEQMIISIQGAPFEGKMKLHVADLLFPPTWATLLSVVILAFGWGLYVRRAWYESMLAAVSTWRIPTADRLYDSIFNAIPRIAVFTTRLLQNGRLNTYIRTMLLVTMVLLALAAFRTNLLGGGSLHISALDVVIGAGIIACSVCVLFLNSALSVIAVLGGVGFLISLLYVLYGAPDVAMTQFAVETLIVVIFILVMYHLPRMRALSNRWQKGADAVIAAGVGVMLMLITYSVATSPAPEVISATHAELSVSEGFGRNVVNVILVDFRALDTLGEIIVLALAAIGVFLLLQKKRPRKTETAI